MPRLRTQLGIPADDASDLGNGDRRHWRFVALDVGLGPHYAATVCAEGTDWHLKCRDWPSGRRRP